GYYQDSWQAQLAAAQETYLEMAGLKPGMAVLETACGTGMVTRRIADQVGATGRVLATDLSGEMIAILSRELAAGRLDNVRTARMGAEALDVDDDSFDAAICALGLMYVPEPRTALAEMARALRPGGQVVATIWGERRNCGWAEIFPIVDAHVASEVCPMFFASGAPGLLVADFASVGLVNIRERRQTEQLAFSDANSLIRAVVQGGPVALAVKRFSEPVLQEVSEQFLASVADCRQRDGSYLVPGEFVTVAAELPG
ncbi:MAG: class I SAM-dependent methyltransferase, partial [Paracoccaceae bacterium]